MSLPTTTLTIKTRGRNATPVEVPVLGTVMPSGQIDTTALRGHAIMDLISEAQTHGLDPSEALAVGINELRLRQARETAPPLPRALLDGGLVGAPREARLGAMHINKLAKMTGLSPALVIEALRHAKEAA